MFEDARNPKWVNSSRSQIVLEVKFAETGEWAPFVASPTDCTDYGPMLYYFALNGKFGPIAVSDEERIIAGEMQCPEGYAVIDGQIVNTAVIEQEAVAELNRRLAEWNSEEAKATAEISEDYAVERKEKIAALLAVKKQDGWPLTVEWPE